MYFFVCLFVSSRVTTTPEDALYVDAPRLPGLKNSGNSNFKTGDF